LNDSSNGPQSSHPYWQVLLAYGATLVVFVASLKLLPPLTGLDRDRVGWTALGLLALLFQPQVWWAWELGSIRQMRSRLGDVPVRLFYGALGLTALYAGLFTKAPFWPPLSLERPNPQMQPTGFHD
jgi:hypothetical protein